jgi:putative transmembrane protein PGPGW
MSLARLLRRIAITIAGVVIVAVGVVLLVAPGPGLLVILLGLIVFAVEYEWARRRLVDVRERARSAADKAAASRVATATAILFGVGTIGLGGVLIFSDVLPLSGVGTGASVALGGLTVLATTAYSLREMRRAERAARAERAQAEAADGPAEPPAGSRGAPSESGETRTTTDHKPS